MQVTVAEDDIHTMSGNNTLFQNLGPGTLYVGSTLVTEGDGLRIDVGKWVKLESVSTIGLVASGGDCDVRYQVAAGAVGAAEAPA